MGVFIRIDQKWNWLLLSWAQGYINRVTWLVFFIFDYLWSYQSRILFWMHSWCFLAFRCFTNINQSVYLLLFVRLSSSLWFLSWCERMINKLIFVLFENLIINNCIFKFSERCGLYTWWQINHIFNSRINTHIFIFVLLGELRFLFADLGLWPIINKFYNLSRKLLLFLIVTPIINIRICLRLWWFFRWWPLILGVVVLDRAEIQEINVIFCLIHLCWHSLIR